MTEGAKETIAMLEVLKENSYSGRFTTGKDFTMVKDCKKESFDFIIDQAIAYIIRGAY